MQAIILAGGFAKRLWPLTLEKPKPLLSVNNKPIIEYLLEKIDELDVKDIIVSTNMKFKNNFEKWLSSTGRKNIRIIAEESTKEEEKLGAVKALARLSNEIIEDCLIAAGDNIFTESLVDFKRMFEKLKAPIVCLYDVREVELAKNYSIAILENDGRIVEFVEKPQNPKTTLIGTCLYIFPREVFKKLNEYVSMDRDCDAPGRFIEWLCKEIPVYGYTMHGMWWDIGTIKSYEDAKRYFAGKR
ncbi:MAG: nucleotidyltransferase family protein [Nitrososphaeria archaeon]|nr:nucleotidyltransferase family protein [Nitrososphaeria archaeon]